MVHLTFELPSALATTLHHEAGNQQNRVDEIVEFALLEYFNTDPSDEQTTASADLNLAPKVLAKMNAIAAKAGVDMNTLVKLALRQYFSQDLTAAKTLPSILQRLTGIHARTTNA